MTTLVIPSWILSSLRDLSGLDIESGAVLLARMVHTPLGDLRFLATELLVVPDDAYTYREWNGLSVTSAGFVPALRRAEETASTAFWVHTHPGNGSSPAPSEKDDVVDGLLSPVFRLRAGAEFYGSLILAPHDGTVRFTGLIDGDTGRFPVDRIWSVGSRFSLLENASGKRSQLSPVFDRNIRAFGGDIQHVLHQLCVAVVGCGGTGSAVAEQLVRLGVRRFVLIDPDRLSDSNVTRVYGSRPGDVGRQKVEVLGDHLRGLSSEVVIQQLPSKITVERTARVLIDADVVFGCTDDNAGRLVHSRLASFFLTPVIDCGVILTSGQDGHLEGIHGRVTVLHPGGACLVCRGRIDLARAAAEALTPQEHRIRAGEGYAPDLPGVEPAVVSYTSMVAAQAVGELLERLVGYGPAPVPNEIVLRIHEREISTNIAEPRKHHYCHPDSKKLGLGLTDPFLEQAWGA